MSKKITRTVALLTAIAALCALLTACVPFGSSSQSPSVDNKETELTVPYEQRKLIFQQAAASVQVNTNSPIGYFCYEDNPYRILTDKQPTEEGAADDSVSYTVTVYDGLKNEDGSNKVSEDKYTAKIEENGYLYLNSQVIGDVEISASCANGSTMETVSVPVVRRALSVWNIIMLGIGLYLLFAAITGKGRLYEAEFVKEGMEKKYKNIIRIGCLIVALLMIADGVVSALDAYGNYRIVSTIIFGAILVVIIVEPILLNSLTDKEAKKEAQEKRLSGRDLKAPNAAFDFDEDEPTLDDLKNSADKE